MNINSTEVGKNRIYERASSEPCRMEKRSRHADEITLNNVSPFSTHEAFESGGLSEADAQVENDSDSDSQKSHQQEAELPRNNDHSNDHSNGNNGNSCICTPAENAARDKLLDKLEHCASTQQKTLDKLGHYERNVPKQKANSTQKEGQDRGNNSFEVHQSRENKDQLQQEEELNQGHTNTQSKRHAKKSNRIQKEWQDRGTRNNSFEVQQSRENNTQTKRHAQKPGNCKRRNERISWDDRIQDLKDFRETFGHCRVKQSFEDNLPLGRFVSKMRAYKIQIKKGIYTGSVLTTARIKELDDLGFEWTARAFERRSTFEQRIEQLKAFRYVHGHLRITGALDMQLSTFCRHMRQARRKPTSRGMHINEERIKALDEIGFDWSNLKRSRL